MQLAVTKAVQAAVWGVTQEFASLLFVGNDSILSTGKDFPYDVPFLPIQSLQQIKALATEHNYEAWPQDRLVAYQSKDMCARRAAVSSFLWQRYTDDSTMTLEKLKLWHEVEVIERVLSVPSWFRQQHYHENVDILWQERLRPHKAKLATQHQEVLMKILKM